VWCVVFFGYQFPELAQIDLISMVIQKAYECGKKREGRRKNKLDGVERRERNGEIEREREKRVLLIAGA